MPVRPPFRHLFSARPPFADFLPFLPFLLFSSFSHPRRSTRLGAAVLSHHVDEFSLVSAFFLFSIACLNILLGLIFREKAKAHRSITSWREQYKDDSLPTTSLGPPRQLMMSTGATAVSWDRDAAGAETARSGSLSSQKSGMGFGRQGEKAALARGERCWPLLR